MSKTSYFDASSGIRVFAIYDPHEYKLKSSPKIINK